MNNECIEVITQSLIKVHENGKQAVIRNAANEVFIRTKVDGCLVKNKTASDWVISKDRIGDVVIELKGSDVDHALKQVEETIKFWKAAGKGNGAIAALIVCSRYPRVDTKIQRAKLAMAKKHGSPLHIITKNLEYEFEALLSFRGPLKV